MDIKESLQRILQSEEIFGDKFYDIFFKRCPEAAEYFANTDMHRQALMLTMALSLMVQYHSEGFSSIEEYLRHLGGKHQAHRVPPELYPAWRDAMLETMKEFHENDWDDDLSAQWREAIEAVSKPMLRGYDQHTGV